MYLTVYLTVYLTIYSPKSLFPFVTISANADAPYNELTKIASVNTPNVDDSSNTDNKDDKDEKVNEDKDDEDSEDDNGDATNATAVYTVYQLPENVKVETGEECQECLIQFRAKLFRFEDLSKTNTNKDEKSKNNNIEPSSEWKEVGIGPIKLLQSTNKNESSSSSSSRIVMRREDKQGGNGNK
jgi:hypothetical protein